MRFGDAEPNRPVIPLPPNPDGGDTGEKREHTSPLEEAEEDELRDMIGYKHMIDSSRPMNIPIALSAGCCRT
jgi:hypothetical protein